MTMIITNMMLLFAGAIFRIIMLTLCATFCSVL